MKKLHEIKFKNIFNAPYHIKSINFYNLHRNAQLILCTGHWVQCVAMVLEVLGHIIYFSQKQLRENMTRALYNN